MVPFGDGTVNLTHLPLNKSLLFLMLFDGHFISAACSPQKNNSGLVLTWWDSLPARTKPYVDRRSATINTALQLVRQLYPSHNVDAKRARSQEQAPASNDCGVFAVQNLVDFAGVKSDVSREWLRQFATGLGRMS